MSSRILRAVYILLLSVSLAAQGKGDPDTGKVVLYRDEYGVPHIYAPTVEAGAYAVGHAQAEDRLEELLKNMLRGTGEMAAAFGPDEYNNDLQNRLWQHSDFARKNFQ